MALRGLKLTWVCIASLFISCSIILSFKFKIVHFCYFQNTFPFVSTFQQTYFIKKKRRKHFVEQGIPGMRVTGIDYHYHDYDLSLLWQLSYIKNTKIFLVN